MKLSRGYTLIELILVIVLISILSTIALVKYPAPAKMYLQASRTKLIRDLRFAQNAAILQKQITGVKLDFAQNSYKVYQGNQNYSNVINDPSLSSRYEILFNSLFPGVKLSATNLIGEFVQFDSRGVPYDSAGKLLAAAQITLSELSGSPNVSITIMPETGLIK